MSFFDQPQRPAERRRPSRQPAWRVPPENEIGVAVPLRLVLGRSDELAVALIDVVAYSPGFSLRLALRVHPQASDVDPRLVMMQLHGGPGVASEDQLRFGVAFADGRKATNLGGRPSVRSPSDEAPAISLSGRGGGGGGGGLAWEFGYWVYPLPPSGALTLAIAWPARALAEQTHVLDAAPILAAAALSEVLWPDERPLGSDRPPPAPGSAAPAPS